MQADIFDCSICFDAYNRSVNIPKILPTCGHTVCSSCLDQILGGKQPSLCPLDRAEISQQKTTSKTFPTNLFVLQLLDEQGKVNREFCATHREPKTFTCMDDMKTICKFCMENGEHKGHKTIVLDEVKTKAEKKRNELESQLKRFKDEEYNKISADLDKQQDIMEKMIMKKFDQFKELLLNQKMKVMAGIRDYFTSEKQKFNAKLQKDLAIKERLTDNVKILYSHDINENFFKALAYEEKEDFTANLANFFKAEIAPKNLHACDFAFKEIERLITEKFQALPLLLEPIIIQEDFSNQNSSSIENSNALQMNFSDGQIPQINFSDSQIPQNNQSEVKTTQDLKLNLSMNPVLNQDFSHIWRPLLAEIESPEAIDLNLKYSRVTDHEISEFFNAIANNSQNFLPTIKRFSLNLAHTAITDRTMKQFTLQILPLLLSVESFKLYLGSTHISELCAKEIIAYFHITLTEKIHTFTLFLSDIKITDLTLISLTSSISALKNLKHLQLGFSGTKVSDSGLELILKNLSGVASNLQTLALYFGNAKISDSSIKVLYKEVMPKIKMLRNLTLDLSASEVSDSGMLKLFSAMDEKVSSLKTLTLHLALLRISDKTIEVLAKNVMPRLSQLENFTLNLSNTRVKDSSLTELLNNMGIAMERLKSFTLDLSGTKVSDATVHALNRQLYAISGGSLESLKLLLKETQVTDKSIGEFCRVVNKYWNPERPLQKLEVMLNQTKVKEETVRLVQETKKKVLISDD